MIKFKLVIGGIHLVVDNQYVWLMGAEEMLVTFVGRSINHPDLVKLCGSSVGHGFLFRWPDGRLFEIGSQTIRQWVKVQPDEDNDLDPAGGHGLHSHV